MKKSFAIILAIVVGVICSLTTFIMVSIINDSTLKGDEDSLSLTEFSNVEQIIEDHYLRDYDIQDLQYAGLKAIVASLDDPYSVYYTPEEFNAFNQEASGEYFGVGMLISMDEITGLAVVEFFFDGSAAKEAGIEVGDLIVSIDGEDVTKRTLQEISVLCTGKEGMPITMGVKRGDEVLEFEMVRKAVAWDMVVYEMLDDEIGYMDIAQFGGNCEELFAKGMEFFQQNNAKGILIDLRDNPGGYLSTVVHMLDLLLPEGTVVYTEDKHGNRETFTSDAKCIDIPLTLIVNGNTASAAEIFAGAVQDYDYGEVVGTTTYGKGVVQVIIPIPSTGGGMKITSSEYFTPNGRNIDGNGIYPDLYVELPSDVTKNQENYSLETDIQVEKALEVLAKSIN